MVNFVNAGGTAKTETTLLLTVEELDEATVHLDSGRIEAFDLTHNCLLLMILSII